MSKTTRDDIVKAAIWYITCHEMPADGNYIRINCDAHDKLTAAVQAWLDEVTDE